MVPIWHILCSWWWALLALTQMETEPSLKGLIFRDLWVSVASRSTYPDPAGAATDGDPIVAETVCDPVVAEMVGARVMLSQLVTPSLPHGLCSYIWCSYGGRGQLVGAGQLGGEHHVAAHP